VNITRHAAHVLLAALAAALALTLVPLVAGGVELPVDTATAYLFPPMYVLADGRNESCSFTLNVGDRTGAGGLAELLAHDGAVLTTDDVPAGSIGTLALNHGGEGIYEATAGNTTPLRVRYHGEVTPVASLIDPAIPRPKSCLPAAPPTSAPTTTAPEATTTTAAPPTTTAPEATTTTVEPTTTTAAEAPATTQPVDTSSTRVERQLPATGTASAWLVRLGAVLVGFGVVLVHRARALRGQR
jgi:cell division septation protein DedD